MVDGKRKYFSKIYFLFALETTTLKSFLRNIVKEFLGVNDVFGYVTLPNYM
jgi:hypothetical protein